MPASLRHPRRRTGRTPWWGAALLALLAPATAGAMIPSATMTPVPRLVSDFSLVARGGTFHLFHTLGAGGNAFGHWVSTDLYHWSARPDVLVGTQAIDPARPDGRNGWNRDRVWAPSIVLHHGVYHLFYTGVRVRPGLPGCLGQLYQAIGLATSTDLETWRLEPDPWMSPAKVPWALQDTCAYDFGNFRDPSVTWDPVSGEWRMVYTTTPSEAAVSDHVTCAPVCGVGCWYTSRRFVLGSARAPAGFTRASDWTDGGALWRSYQTDANSGCYSVWESPHLFRHSGPAGDLWYLFASAGVDLYANRLVYLTSPATPTGPGAWTMRGLLEGMGVRDPYGNTLGPYEAYGWVASEYLLDPADGREYFANTFANSVQIRQIRWHSQDDGFDLVEPFRILSIEPDRATAIAGATVNLVFDGRNCVDPIGARTVPIEAVRLDEHGTVVETVRASDLGLPSVVTLTGDRTVVPWVAREWPADSMARLRVRLKDTSTGVVSPTITVAPARFASVGDEPGARPGGLALHVLDSNPTADAVRFAFELPEPLAIRLEVFDASGRRVCTLAEGPRSAGRSEARWDRRDAAGRSVGGGVYFARLATALGARTARLVVLPER